MRIMRSSRAGTFQDKVMRFCLRSISIDTVSPFSYERRIRIACDGFVGFRPPMDVITSPPFKGSVESAGAFTTRTPSFVPKYSPKSELRLTSSRSPQGEPNISKRSMPSIGPQAISGGPGISIWNFPPMSAATSVVCFVSLPRRNSTFTVSSGSSLRASSTSFLPGPDSSSSSAFTPASDVPLNLVMMSPTLMPALSAGPPGVTPSILAPSLTVSALASVCTITPIRPRWSLKANVRTRGGRGGRGVPCATSPIGPAASAAATMIHLDCICISLRASEAHVRGTRDASAHELLHEIHPLLPQLDELGATCLDLIRVQLSQLAVDDGNPVLQRGAERRGAAARHLAVGVVTPQLLLERRRLRLDAREVGGVDRCGPEWPEHEQRCDGGGRRHTPYAPALSTTAPCGKNGVAHGRPAVAPGPARRQGLELRDALVQRLELGPACRAGRYVFTRPHRRLPALERQQIFHRTVHHRATPSSSIHRRRVCARANCDLENLTVLPICSAISSWVYPSTSCSHTTARAVSERRSNARSRSTPSATPAPPPTPATDSS